MKRKIIINKRIIKTEIQEEVTPEILVHTKEVPVPPKEEALKLETSLEDELSIEDFNKNVRKMILERNDLYKPYKKLDEPVPETVKNFNEETRKINRDNKVISGARTRVPVSRK